MAIAGAICLAGALCLAMACHASKNAALKQRRGAWRAVLLLLLPALACLAGGCIALVAVLAVGGGDAAPMLGPLAAHTAAATPAAAAATQPWPLTPTPATPPSPPSAAPAACRSTTLLNRSSSSSGPAAGGAPAAAPNSSAGTAVAAAMAAAAPAPPTQTALVDGDITRTSGTTSPAASSMQHGNNSVVASSGRNTCPLNATLTINTTTITTTASSKSLTSHGVAVGPAPSCGTPSKSTAAAPQPTHTAVNNSSNRGINTTTLPWPRLSPACCGAVRARGTSTIHTISTAAGAGVTRARAPFPTPCAHTAAGGGVMHQGCRCGQHTIQPQLPVLLLLAAILALAATIWRLRAQLRAARSDLACRDSQLQDTQHSLAGTRAELQSTQQRLQGERRAHKYTAHKLQESKAHAGQVKRAVRGLRTMVIEWISTSSAEVSDLKASNHELRQHKAAQVDKFDQLKDDCRGVLATLAATRDENSILHNTICIRDGDILHLQDTIRLMQHSRDQERLAFEGQLESMSQDVDRMKRAAEAAFASRAMGIDDAKQQCKREVELVLAAFEVEAEELTSESVAQEMRAVGAEAVAASLRSGVADLGSSLGELRAENDDLKASLADLTERYEEAVRFQHQAGVALAGIVGELGGEGAGGLLGQLQANLAETTGQLRVATNANAALTVLMAWQSRQATELESVNSSLLLDRNVTATNNSWLQAELDTTTASLASTYGLVSQLHQECFEQQVATWASEQLAEQQQQTIGQQQQQLEQLQDSMTFLAGELAHEGAKRAEAAATAAAAQAQQQQAEALLVLMRGQLQERAEEAGSNELPAVLEEEGEDCQEVVLSEGEVEDEEEEEEEEEEEHSMASGADGLAGCPDAVSAPGTPSLATAALATPFTS